MCCVDLDVSGHWGPQFWVWQCCGSSSPAPHGSEVGQLEWQPGSWLEARAVSGLQRRDGTILHSTLGVLGGCFASTDRNRTFFKQTNAPKSCLDPQENKAQTKPLGHLSMQNRQWAELLTRCCVRSRLTSLRVLLASLPGVALSAGLGLQAGRREGPGQSPVCHGAYYP